MRVVLLPIYYKNDNRIETCQIFIRDSEELCILDVDRDSGFKRYEADSFFEALTNYRLDLEKEGGILQCNGADKCVFPSPMQLNFGGEKAYFLEMGKQASLNNVYEIFDQDKPNLNCVSVAEQKQFYEDWFTFYLCCRDGRLSLHLAYLALKWTVKERAIAFSRWLFCFYSWS